MRYLIETFNGDKNYLLNNFKNTYLHDTVGKLFFNISATNGNISEFNAKFDAPIKEELILPIVVDCFPLFSYVIETHSYARDRKLQMIKGAIEEMIHG